MGRERRGLMGRPRIETAITRLRRAISERIEKSEEAKRRIIGGGGAADVAAQNLATRLDRETITLTDALLILQAEEEEGSPA
jgi:hypothetical protein